MCLEKATTYAADRTTVIEADLSVTTSIGTDTLLPVNHQQRCRYGSNNYKESAIRQFINSDAASFAWTPKTNFDRPPSGASILWRRIFGGKLLDQELVGRYLELLTNKLQEICQLTAEDKIYSRQSILAFNKFTEQTKEL